MDNIVNRLRIKKFRLPILTIAVLFIFHLATPVKGADDTPIFTQDEKTWLSEHPVISYAADPDFPPVEMVDEHGNHVGISAEVITAIGHKLGVRFKHVPVENWDDLLKKGKTREVDMWSGAMPTPDRLQYMLFTKPYIELPSAFFVRKDSHLENITIDRLKGLKVAVTSNYATHDYLLSKYPELNVHSVSDVLDGLKEVSSGTVDVFLANRAVANHLIEKKKMLNIRVGGVSEFSIQLSLASRNDWPLLNRLLEKGLTLFTPEEREVIYEKWITLDKVSTTKPKDVFLWVFSILGILGFISIVAWTRSLKNLVDQRTQDFIKAREEAERANQTKSDFLSSMSHELRTPLNAIIGFAQLLKRNKEQTLTERQKQNVQEIHSAGKHLLDLINDVLDLSKIESGSLTLSLEKIEITSIVNEVISISQPLTEEKNIKLINHISVKSPGHVFADRTRLRQVLINLISNAIKYNKENGSVTIDSELTSEVLKVNVSDTGLGISEENQKNVFDRFNRGNEERTEIEGTGIGLTITKRLMDMMGGSISLKSQIDVGSSFTLHLKKFEQEAHQLRPVNSPAIPKETNTSLTEEPLTVLYVEDNPSNLSLMEQIFEDDRPQIKLLSAPLARTGIELARAHCPDLILMDINLPEMDGITAFKLLKTHEETSQIPVMAVSANAMQKDIDIALKAGFKAYIVKPFDPVEFLNIMDRVLGESTKARKAD